MFVSAFLALRSDPPLSRYNAASTARPVVRPRPSKGWGRRARRCFTSRPRPTTPRPRSTRVFLIYAPRLPLPAFSHTLVPAGARVAGPGFASPPSPAQPHLARAALCIEAKMSPTRPRLAATEHAATACILKRSDPFTVAQDLLALASSSLQLVSVVADGPLQRSPYVQCQVLPLRAFSQEVAPALYPVVLSRVRPYRMCRAPLCS